MQFTTTNKSRVFISTSMYTLNGKNKIRNAQCWEYERYLQNQITAQQTCIDNEKLTQKTTRMKSEITFPSNGVMTYVIIISFDTGWNTVQLERQQNEKCG
ncbi:hypothetical protein FWK35_00033549 [Aphis craccivora]|uniref:Uncharacterized protein n=1 Tax=Aphis craccivora TaxID=307492 RepID=A0A6G0VK89_APHCR|nr:hypothetical protein FWK35_00033549 [Aphis craccivora]